MDRAGDGGRCDHACLCDTLLRLRIAYDHTKGIGVGSGRKSGLRHETARARAREGDRESDSEISRDRTTRAKGKGLNRGLHLSGGCVVGKDCGFPAVDRDAPIAGYGNGGKGDRLNAALPGREGDGAQE